MTLQVLEEHWKHSLRVEESTYCLGVHACGEMTAWESGIFLVHQMRSGRLRPVDSISTIDAS